MLWPVLTEQSGGEVGLGGGLNWGVKAKGRKGPFTYFQKVGLKAIEAADTGRDVELVGDVVPEGGGRWEATAV